MKILMGGTGVPSLPSPDTQLIGAHEPGDLLPINTKERPEHIIRHVADISVGRNHVSPDQIWYLSFLVNLPYNMYL